MIDADLADLYGVPTKALNQAVKRNADRFPEDFLFQLTKEEKTEVVTNCDHLARLKFSPKRPMAFTEHGAIMAAMVLKTPRAVEMSVQVVRAFIRLREMLATNKELAHKLAELERKLEGHDQAIGNIFEAIRQLLSQPEPKRSRIGFEVKEKRVGYGLGLSPRESPRPRAGRSGFG